jgi:hypothetical protein
MYGRIHFLMKQANNCYLPLVCQVINHMMTSEETPHSGLEIVASTPQVRVCQKLAHGGRKPLSIGVLLRFTPGLEGVGQE